MRNDRRFAARLLGLVAAMCVMGSLLLTAGCRHEEKITAPGYYNGPMLGRHITRKVPHRGPNGKLDMDS